MNDGDKRKQSVYFSNFLLAEIEREATRLDRSLSWIVQRAWRLARQEIRSTPTTSLAGATTGSTNQREDE
jgi:uncharacterized small protein (TIGR04563 family)